MKDYIHNVKYYETDMMGIVHHSNYIRWMEEARIEFLAEVGLNYAEFEKIGILSPIVSVEGKYISPSKFGENIKIEDSVIEFKGIRINLKYVMKNELDNLVFEGISENCFVGKDLRPIRLKKEYPEIYKKLESLSSELK